MVNGGPAAGIWKDITALVLGPMLLVGFYFRTFFLSRGGALYGNDADPSFINAIHEYLYQAVLHHQSLRDLPFFFPARDVIGYSDAFMLDLPIYSALRIAGFDPFVSFEWLLILLTIVGFVGFYLVMRLLLRVNNALLAAAGAAVATMPSNFVLEAIGLGHAQQFAQHFLVWAALLSVLPLVRKDLFVSRVARARWCGVAGGLLFGLTFATVFYPTWFFVFYCLIVIAVAIAILWRREKLSSVINKCIERRALTWWLAGLLPGLIVFAYLYLGALRTLGTRNIHDYLTLAHTAVDVINVGSAELLWGRLFPIQRVWPISSFDQPGHFLALTPVLLLSCAASAAYWWKKRSSTNPLLRSLILGTVAAIGLVFLLTLKQGDVTPFEFVRWIVPGAGAIRVGMRGQIIASALAAVVVTTSAAHILDSIRARFARAIVWVVFGLIVAEQINMIDVHLRQHDSLLAMMASTPMPPTDCKVVYFTGRRPIPTAGQFEGAVRAIWEYNAMWRALAINKPTINGTSGWYPPGWTLTAVDDIHVEEAAHDWAAKNGLHDLCAYDVGTGNWRRGEP